MEQLLFQRLKGENQVNAEFIMRSCLFLFLDLLPKKKRKESPTDWSYHFLVPGLIKQEWTLLSGESDVYILITDLPKCTELSGQQVGCSEVPGQTVFLICDL